MSFGGKRWSWPGRTAEAQILARELDILPAVAAVLLNRGVTGVRQARDFLNPSLEQLHSPWQMQGMERCVERLGRALQEKENIVVYGDYDADGICATAILVEALARLGGRVKYFLPSRFNGGYGLHREALAQLKESGAGLVVTVDCGTNAVVEAAYARELGLDLIITDHHQPLSETPPAVAVLNPLQPGCPYPFKELAGAGVAFKLAGALYDRFNKPLLLELLDLAALGTMADAVPLRGENRIIAAAGLEEIRSLHRPGLQALAAATALKGEKINSRTVAFVLAPSINAPGRMGEAEPAVRLLLERGPAEAQALAERLHRDNCLRREMERQLLDEAGAALRADPEIAGSPVITLAGEGWHHGIAGIVASRLVERYHRPVVLIALDGETGRGTARSIPGFDITAALQACANLLERFGGHEQASGFTIAADRVESLRRSLNDYAAEHLQEEDLLPALELDGELSAEELSLELARQLAWLQPFGRGNPEPLFYTRGWELNSWRLVGADQSHLRLSFTGKNGAIDTIYFSGAGLAVDLCPGREMELAVKLKEDLFLGEPRLEIQLKDLRYTDSARSGRVEVIDYRRRGNRESRLKALLRGYPGATVFVATKKRRVLLEKSLPPGAAALFLGSGGSVASGAGAPSSDLILYDLPLHGQLLEPFFQRCPAAGAVRVHLLYTDADRELNQVLLDASLPNPAALEQLCRAMAETAAAGKPVDPEQAAAQQLPYKHGPNYWSRCRSIFSESGLLAPERLKDLSADLTTECLHKLLECSPAYREAWELRQKCSDFQDFLLKAAPDQLAAYWMEQLQGVVAEPGAN